MVADLATCIDFHKPDVIIGSETWINPSIKNEELFPDNYAVVRKDREDSYGGVLVAYKNDFIGTLRMDLDSECEIVWLQIQLVGCKSLTIGAFYRTPSNRDIQYLDQLRNSLSKTKTETMNTYGWEVTLTLATLIGQLKLSNRAPQLGSIANK